MDEKRILLCIVQKNIKCKRDEWKNVIDLFNRYRVIDYIRDYYEALHTTGRQYIVDDINMYIEARQSSMG